MSLDTTATIEWESITREAEVANRFIKLYNTKGYVEALAYHSLLSSDLKDYIQYCSLSQGLYDDARQQLEGDLR